MHREQQVPHGWVIVDIHVPTNTPWDYYGRRHQNELMYVLQEAGIPAVALETERRAINPRGTGPGGTLRFGDDMVPGEYRIAVRNHTDVEAMSAIQAFQTQVKEWLDHKGEIPEAVLAVNNNWRHQSD